MTTKEPEPTRGQHEAALAFMVYRLGITDKGRVGDVRELARLLASRERAAYREGKEAAAKYLDECKLFRQALAVRALPDMPE